MKFVFYERGLFCVILIIDDITVGGIKVSLYAESISYCGEQNKPLEASQRVKEKNYGMAPH